MANDHMLNDLMFEDKIKKFNDPEQFLARQLRELQLNTASRLTNIETECKNRAANCPINLDYSGDKSRLKRDLTVGVGSAGGLSLVYVIAKAIAAHYGIVI